MYLDESSPGTESLEVDGKIYLADTNPFEM